VFGLVSAGVRSSETEYVAALVVEPFVAGTPGIPVYEAAVVTALVQGAFDVHGIGLVQAVVAGYVTGAL
jgi:adenosylmethionine-8-amino-7-oxononanoate aminotransferase